MLNLEQQVVSLELSKELKKLGVKQESLFYWFEYKNKELRLFYQLGPTESQIRDLPGKCIGCYSAFTTSELGEMLPAYIDYKKGPEDCFQLRISKWKKGYSVEYERQDYRILDNNQKGETLADTLAKMLIYLIKNKLMETK
jgi:hypothetical protein